MSTASRSGLRRTARQQGTARRESAGYTLIELLIVISIIILLATFTIVAVDLTFESERVRSGARQVQSLLEGARDRAIHAREPRGVRFLVDQDPDNGRMVSSMVYVGAAQPWTEGQITLKRPDFNDDGVVDDLDGDGSPDDEVLMIDGAPNALWDALKRRGFLGVYETTVDINGNGVLDQDTPRIKIPGDKNGTWYRVRTDYIGRDPRNPNRLRLIQAYRDPGTTPPNEVVAFEGTGPSTYVLELPPRILADADPVALPDGVVIDLDASAVPAFWRPSGGSYSVAYSNRMDVMFSPRGTIVGSAAGSGLLHFYIGLRDDVQKCMDTSRPAVNGSSSALAPADGKFSSLPNSPPVGDRSLVSIFTSTGKVASHPINVIDVFNNGSGAAGGDGYLDDPFVFAELGEVSSK